MTKALKTKNEELKELFKNEDKDAVVLKLAEQSLELEKANADLEASNKDVEELNAQLAEYESGKKKAPKHPSVTIDKKEYLVTQGIRIRGDKFTDREIAENTKVVDGKKIANWLLEKGSGVLQLKTPEA